MKENNKELPVVVEWPLTKEGLGALIALIVQDKKEAHALPAHAPYGTGKK
jgi:hypothetical protein